MYEELRTMFKIYCKDSVSGQISRMTETSHSSIALTNFELLAHDSSLQDIHRFTANIEENGNVIFWSKIPSLAKLPLVLAENVNESVIGLLIEDVLSKYDCKDSIEEIITQIKVSSLSPSQIWREILAKINLKSKELISIFKHENLMITGSFLKRIRTSETLKTYHLVAMLYCISKNI